MRALKHILSAESKSTRNCAYFTYLTYPKKKLSARQKKTTILCQKKQLSFIVSKFAENWCIETLEPPDQEYQLHFRILQLKPA